MSSQTLRLRIFLVILLVVPCLGLNTDGVLLLSFKYSVLSDPLSALESWNYSDVTPCSWKGVTCDDPSKYDTTRRRVTALNLPNSHLLGSIPANLGAIEHLQSINLSNNSLNGSLPVSLFNASELQSLDLSNNLISGEIPAIGRLANLRSLNLSDNALAGNLPESLTSLQNLTVISLRNNYFSGRLPTGFNAVQVFDLSSNLIDGSLPSDFGGISLRYLNISYNRIAGEIPVKFAGEIPENATVDLSFNNLTGEIPDSRALDGQETSSFSGNTGLCGKPLRNPCPIPSNLYNSSPEPTSSPAIAAFPRPTDSVPGAISPAVNESTQQDQGSTTSGLRTGTIVGIVVGDVAGIALLATTFLYIFHKRKKAGVADKELAKKKRRESNGDEAIGYDWSSSSPESKKMTPWACLRKRGEDDDEESSGSESGSFESGVNGDLKGLGESQQNQRQQGTLVTVDGERELELENLLRASAYILGATGSSIMYKAVLEDGSTLAVRRIAESGVEKLKDFETQVRVVAKLVHPNLVRVLGFFWGSDDKLIIYDYIPNGSLANARYKKMGSSPCHLPWEIRLKVARGVARGLTYLHDKKHVHGNLKPSNILLDVDMEPKISDFGLERLVFGDSSYKVGGSMRNFGSKRSTASRDSFQDQVAGPSPSPSPSSIGCASPYHAPESLRTLKANPKWDVYAFGVILLELLTGKIVNVDEIVLGQPGPAIPVEERNKILRMADVAIRADLEGKEDALLSCFRLGLNCASQVPQKRPAMKEALQVLEKFPNSFSTSSQRYGS